MIDEEVAVSVIVAELRAMHVPTVLRMLKVTIPVVLADEIQHEYTPVNILVARWKMCFGLDQNSDRSIEVQPSVLGLTGTALHGSQCLPRLYCN